MNPRGDAAGSAAVVGKAAVDASSQWAPVAQWRVAGVDVWPILKGSVLLRLLAAPLGETRIGRSRIGALRMARRFVGDYRLQQWRAWGRTMPPPLEPLPVTLLCLGNTVGTFAHAGLVSQPHLDPARIAMGAQGISSATLLVDAHPECPGVRNALLPDTHGIRARLAHARWRYHPRVAPLHELLEGFASWREALARQSVLAGLVDEPTLRAEVAAVIAQAKCFRELFLARSPAAVLLYNADESAGYAACVAARSLGLPVAEMQHGVQGPHNPSYQWPEMDERGFNVLPSVYLCWSEADAANIRAWGQRAGVRAAVVGYSWRQLENAIVDDGMLATSAQPRVARFRAAFDAARQRAGECMGVPSDSYNVLLTTYREERVDWLPAALQRFPPGCRLWWRLHPGEAQQPGAVERRAAGLPTARVNVEDATRLPLSVVLRHTDLHVTGFSAVALEAASFGVRTVVYSPQGWAFYEGACAGAGIEQVDAGPDVVAAIARAQRQPRRRATAVGAASEPTLGTLADALSTLIAAPKCLARRQH